MKAIKLAVPQGELLNHTAEILEPMFDLETDLKPQNTRLRAQHDLLPWGLISGEIDVSEIVGPIVGTAE